VTVKVPVCYCQPARVKRVGGTTPATRPRSAIGGAQRCDAHGEVDAPGKARDPSYTSDGVKNGVARLRGEGNLRVKRSDP
jgi:hypothetical protein